MPKKIAPKSDKWVKSRPQGLWNVGGVTGLYVDVKDTGARSWIQRVKIGEDRTDLGLGGYPDVELAEARELARENRRLIRGGIDPRTVKAEAKAALSAATRQLSFDAAAKQCHAAKSTEFRNAKHKKDWISSLDRYASPVIGDMPVDTIDLPDVLAVFQRDDFWTSKTDTATKVRQRIESVLAWATVNKFRSGDNPARWKGGLEHALPKPSKISKRQHMRAIPWQEMPAFMADLRKREGMGARALEFAILTAARSGEVRGATWDEFDFDTKVWTVPGDRMKAGKTHHVPLSASAVKLLEALPRSEGSPYVFWAPRGGMLSDMSISAVTRRMAVNAVPHGLARSCFKDWARSSTSYADEVSELALAHVNSDATRAAYARDELLPKRSRLMRDWAKFCTSKPKQAEVTPIRDRNA